MSNPVIYNEKAPDVFKENFSLAKNKYESYIRAKVLIDFFTALAITTIGGTLTYFKDKLSIQNTLILNCVVTLLPPMAAALEKLYQARRERYAQLIDQGKNIGYKKGFFYKENTIDENRSSVISSELAQSETDSSSSISNTSSLYPWMSTSSSQEILYRYDTYKKALASLGIGKLHYVEDMLGVRVNVIQEFKKLKGYKQYKDYTDNQIIEVRVRNISELYKSIKSLERSKLATAVIKSLAAFSIFALGISASILNYRIKTKNQSETDYSNAVYGINIAITAIPGVTFFSLFARSIWYKTFQYCSVSVAKLFGAPSDEISLTLKKLKREAFNRGLFEKPSQLFCRVDYNSVERDHCSSELDRADSVYRKL